jgi:nucleoid-associated protein EbfC
MTEGMPDLQGILAQAQQMQEQLVSAQAALAEQRVEGDAGGGNVTATVTGSGDLVGLTISPEVIDPNEPEILADLVLAAYRDATSKASDIQQQVMDPLTSLLGSTEPDV